MLVLWNELIIYLIKDFIDFPCMYKWNSFGPKIVTSALDVFKNFFIFYLKNKFIHRLQIQVSLINKNHCSRTQKPNELSIIYNETNISCKHIIKRPHIAVMQCLFISTPPLIYLNILMKPLILLFLFLFVSFKIIQLNWKKKSIKKDAWNYILEIYVHLKQKQNYMTDFWNNCGVFFHVFCRKIKFFILS